MKYLLRTWVLGLLVGSLFTGVAAAQPRIATIDLKKIFDNYWRTKQESERVTKRRNEMEAEYKNMVDDYKKVKEDYDSLIKGANDQSVAPDERDRRKRAAEDKLRSMKDKEDELGQYGRTSTATLSELQDRLKSDILRDIRNIVNAKSKSAGYSLVLDSAAVSVAGTPVVMFTNGENDLTDSVLLQLNANQPTDTGKADETPAPEKKDEKKKDAKK
jgi:Skp family chaperone for outer membrane proteins